MYFDVANWYYEQFPISSISSVFKIHCYRYRNWLTFIKDCTFNIKTDVRVWRHILRRNVALDMSEIVLDREQTYKRVFKPVFIWCCGLQYTLRWKINIKCCYNCYYNYCHTYTRLTSTWLLTNISQVIFIIITIIILIVII